MAGGPFPIKDSEFNTYFLLVYAYLTDPLNLARLIMSPENNADLLAQKTSWDTLFPKSQNAATATSTIITEKIELRDEIEVTLHDIYEDFPASVLTQTDRDTLHLPKRDTTNTRRGPIDDIPYADAKAVGGGTVKCRIRVTEDATRASKHRLADGIEMKYVLIDPAAAATGGTPDPTKPDAGKVLPPVSADECSLNKFSKKSIFTVHFGAAAAGKVLYAFFRWVNLSTPANSSDWTEVKVVHLS